MTTELIALGNMLAATDADDTNRLSAIAKRTAEIAAGDYDPDEKKKGNVLPVATENEPCPHCQSEDVAKWSQGAWRCPECWHDITEKP